MNTDEWRTKREALIGQLRDLEAGRVSHWDEGVETIISLIEPIPMFIRCNRSPAARSLNPPNALKAGYDRQLIFSGKVASDIV